MAQSEYPNRPIRMIIPYTVGGPADAVARLLASKMSDALKQPVIADNRPGANALIGGDVVVKSPPDGYTILSVGGAVYSRVFVKNPPFELMRDLAPISRTYAGGLLLFINAQVPARTVKEFVEYARANPGKLNFGHSASNSMLAMAAFNKLAGITGTLVSYKGGAPVALALAAGDIQGAMDSPLPYTPHLQAGKIRALAIASDQRLAILPEVPTMSEAGFPYKAEFNGGLWAPAGTPRPIIERLNATVVDAVRSPDVVEAVRRTGSYAAGSTPEGFRQIVQAEIDFWADAAKTANFQPE